MCILAKVQRESQRNKLKLTPRLKMTYSYNEEQSLQSCLEDNINYSNHVIDADKRRYISDS